MNLQYKLLKNVSKTMYGANKGIEILKEKWNYLIILDACRCDAFLKVIDKFSISGTLECKYSRGSSTPEFIMENFYSKKAHDVVYVNANPMVDYVLREDKHRIFYRFIPVWVYAWDPELETVTPASMYYYALRTFIKYPYKRIIIHFLQPHFPFIGKRYRYINDLVRESIKRVKRLALESNYNSQRFLFQGLRSFATILNMIIFKRAIATEAELYLSKEIEIKDIIRAYLDNINQVLNYVVKLIRILPGIIIITADHGEAFGEYLHPLIPVQVYGHPTGIHIPSLIRVPWLVVDNRHKPVRKTIREAIREIIKLKISEKSQ